jgi:hypothetical protein
MNNTGNTSIADTGRFWKILVIPVLQILENTGYTSIADIGRLGRIPVNPSFYVYIIIVYQYCSTSIAAGCFILS